MDRPAQYESARRDLTDIETLIQQAERDFDSRIPDLVAIGQVLFRWLDGENKRLRSPSAVVVLLS